MKFTKMHGLGNDFVIIDAINQTIDNKKLPIAKLSNRYTGIGFDQLLMVGPSKKADFFCRIFNSDGSQAEQCGNGLRCIARFIHERGLHCNKAFSIETIAGIFPITIEDYNHIQVTMGAPHIVEKLIEFAMDQYAKKIPVSILSIGNPHTIINTAAIDQSLIDQLGPAISTHSSFPNGTNVGFMQIINPHHIRLRTFERGAGETHACGSNACAAVVAGMSNQWLKEKVNVEFRYGVLSVEWNGTTGLIYLTGPAEHVFDGVIV